MKKLIIAAALAAVFGLAGCNLGTSGFGTITIPGEWPPSPPSNYRPGDRWPIGPEDLDMGEVRLGGGTFLMGSPPNEIGRQANEGQQRWVTISADFWISETPVTQAQWVSVMGSNPSFHTTPVPGEAQGRRPVEMVSWFDVLVFANLLSEQERFTPAYMINGSTDPVDWGPVPTGLSHPNFEAWNAVQIVPGSTGFRLPTEAQWEFAARAGTTTAFSDGTQDWNDQAALDRIGWFNFNNGGVTREVMQKEPNPLGLYDIHGNVAEWVWDRAGDPPTSQAQTDPAGPDSGNNRVVRGGSWNTASATAPAPALTGRSAYRDHPASFLRFSASGFRLVRP
ncbi:MAG: formylglycine-generating enzyme family protein [Spirochaetes bacterium]|nr:formylglycine-generating enzyme family protein [Spirochaetota bacterium]